MMRLQKELRKSGGLGAIGVEQPCVYLSSFGEMNKCLEARRKGYEAVGADWLMPDVHEDEEGYQYDEYGCYSESDMTEWQWME